jgi:preprotein translocase subunit YajC
MDKLKLRYLIREVVENVVNISSKFSVGDKVTTVDGDTATVTMAEHPFYTVELEETGTTKSFNFKDLAPFQEKEIAPKSSRNFTADCFSSP